MKNLLFILFVQFIFIGHSQDLLFSSKDFSSMSVNPAISGTYNDWQSTIIYRNQFLHAGSPFNSYLVSGHFTFLKKQSSPLTFGIECSSIITSINSIRNDLKSSLGYHLRLDDFKKLSLSLYGGLISQFSNANKNRWASQYDGNTFNSNLSSGEMIISNQVNKFDIGAGIVYSSKKSFKIFEPTFQTGFAIFHLNQPDLSNLNNGSAKLPLRSSVFAKYAFRTWDNKRVITPSFIFNIQEKFIYYTAGTDVKWEFISRQRFNLYGNEQGKTSFLLGFYYRFPGAIIIQALIQKSILTFGLSYDMNLDIRNKATLYKGATELLLKFSL